jgi:hypothetical protein
MAIANRELDSSQKQQVEVLTVGSPGTVTAKEYHFYQAPQPLQINNAYSSCLTLSGTPTGTLKLKRFIVGSGATTISISGALTHTIFGTSGVQQLSMPAVGSSLLQLQTNDLLVWVAAGSNAAVENLSVAVVLQAIQDIKSWF